MDSYLKNNSSKASKNIIDEAKENKDKSPSNPTSSYLQKNSSENFSSLARERLFDPKDYILKERLNEFNKKNLNKIKNLNSDNNLLNKSINDKRSISGNYNTITHQDHSLNTRDNPTPNFSDFKTIDYLDNIYNNRSKKTISSKNQKNEEEDIADFINEAHECIKNHITETKTSIANISDKNSSNYTKSNLTKNPMNDNNRGHNSENYLKVNNLNRNINKIIKSEDSYMNKLQQDKISKKHRDIDDTLEEIKNNLNNLSQKFKSNDIKNISKNTITNKFTAKKGGFESSESDGEIEYTSKKFKNNDFDLKNKNIGKISLGEKKNNLEENRFITNNTNRSYSSGDSVLGEDYSKSLFDRKFRGNKSKTKFIDSGNLNAFSSYNTKFNQTEYTKNQGKFSNLDKSSKNLTKKNFEDSIDHKIKSNSKNKLEAGWSSDKKYYNRKKFTSGNMLMSYNKEEAPGSNNLINNLNNSISLLKEKNNKYKNYNDYKTYGDYQKTKGNEDNKNLDLNQNESKVFNRNKFNIEELKGKNDSIEKELDLIKQNFKEIKSMAKEKKADKQEEIQINDKNLNIMFQSIQNPKEFATIKRKTNPLAGKSHDLSISDSYKKAEFYKTYQNNYISESDDDLRRNDINNLNKKGVFSDDAREVEMDAHFKKENSAVKNKAYRSVNVFPSAAGKENNKNALKIKSKEKDNYKFYYVKKNIENVSNSRNKNKDHDGVRNESIANSYYLNSANIKNKNKDIAKGGKIVGTKLNKTEKDSNKYYDDNFNLSKLNKTQERFENASSKKAIYNKSTVPNQIQINSNINENTFNRESEQSHKIIPLLEKKIENYEEKISSYKNLLNEYMPEDISHELFTIINSYLNGKDRWFLLKRNLLRDQANNLFWVREAELMNLGFNINFNLFKNDNFDFCLIANNLYKLRDESKRFIGEIEDLKNFLNQELEKREKVLEDKNNEIKKLHDKNQILSEYIKKLEDEKQSNDLAVFNTPEKYNNEALLEENKQLNMMIEDFKINIKNLLEDNLKFKAENEKLEFELKALKADLNSEKSLKKSSSLGKIPVQNKTKSNNIKGNSNSKKGLSSNRIKEENKEFNPNNSLGEEELNNSASKASVDLKNKLKSSIIQNLITEKEFYNNRKEFDDVHSQNEKLKSQINSLKSQLEQSKSDLSNVSQKLIETEKASKALTKEKEKNKNISSEKEYMETQIKKIPELINEEITKFKKQKEANEKKHKQALENLQNEKQDLEAKLTEVVNLYNELVDVNKKNENYINELEEIVNKYEVNGRNNEGNNRLDNKDLVEEIENYKQIKTEMEDQFHKEICDLKEILTIKEDNNFILSKNKEILEKEIQDLKSLNHNLNKNLYALKDEFSDLNLKIDNDKKTEINGLICSSCQQTLNKNENGKAAIIKKIEDPIDDNIIIKENSKQLSQAEINDKKKELNVESANNNNHNNNLEENKNKALNEEQEIEDNVEQSIDDQNMHKKANKNYDIPLQSGSRTGSVGKNNISLNSSNLNNVSGNQNQVLEYNNINAQLENKITNLYSVIEDLNKKILDFEKEIAKKDSDLDDLKQNCLEVKEHYEKNYLAPSQIDEILAEINSKHEENLEKIKNYYEKQIENLSNYVKALEHEKEALENNSNAILSKSQKETSDKNLKIKDLEEKLKKLLIMEETSSTSKKIIKDLENVNKDLKERLTSREKEIEKLAHMSKEANEIKNRIEMELNAEKDKFEKYIKNADDEKAQIFEKEIKDLKDKLLESEMNIENFESEAKNKDKLLNDFESEKISNLDKMKKLEKQIKTYEEEKARSGDSLNKIILDLENQKQDLFCKLEKTEKLLAEKCMEITALKANLKNQESELEKRQKFIESLEIENENLVNEMIDYKSLLSENEGNLMKIKNESTDLNTKIEAFEQSLKLSNQKYEKLFEENENHKSNLLTQQEREKALLQRINELENIEEKLKLTVSSFDNNIKHMKDTSSQKDETILNENKNLNEINKNLKKQIEEVEKSLSNKISELENSSAIIKRNDEAIESLRRSYDKTDLKNKEIISSLENKLQENVIKAQETNEIRNELNQKSKEIEYLSSNLETLREEFSKEKEALSNSKTNLESEKKDLLSQFNNLQNKNANDLEDLKRQFEDTLLKKDNENREKLQKTIKDKDSEMQLKEECFAKAQENSLRELNNKHSILTQKLSESENALEEYKNKKSSKSKKLKEEINQLTLHNESLIQKLMEKDEYISEILSELESLKDSNSNSNTDRENQLKSLLNKINDLEKSNISKDAQIRELNDNSQMINKAEEDYKQKISELNNNLNNLASQSIKEMNRYELAIKSLDGIIGNKIKEIELATNEKGEIKKELDKAHFIIEEKENKILEMQGDFKKIAIKINENKENCSNEIEKLKEEKSILASEYEKEIHELKMKLSEREKNSKNLDKKTKSDVSDNTKKKKKDSSKQENLIYNKKDSHNKLSEKNQHSENEEEASANDDFKDLELSLTSEDEENERKSSINEDLVNIAAKDKLKNFENEINQKNLEIQQLKATIANDLEESNKLKEKLSMLESDILEGEIEKQDNEIKLDNYTEEIKSLKALNLELKTNEINLKDELTKLKEDSNAMIDRLTIANEKYLNRINELTEEIGKLNDMNMRTSQASYDVQNSSSVNNEDIEVEILKDELKQKDRKLMDIKEEMIKLKIEIEESSSEINSRQNEINTLKNQNKDLSKKILELNELINVTKKEIQSRDRQIMDLDSKSQNKNSILIVSTTNNLEIVAAQEKDKTNTLLISKNTENSNNPNKNEDDIEFYEEEIQNYKIQIESLKEIIYQKEAQADDILEENQKYINEIENLKNALINTNRITDPQYEQTNTNNNINSTLMSKLTEDLKDDSSGLIVKEKLNKMKATLDNYKADNNNLLQQMNLLKNEMKIAREKYDKLVSFEGKINDFGEFSELISKIFEGFKPKNKIQEEAFKRLNEHFTFLIADKDKDKDKISSNGDETDKKKGGFFENIFKKKK